jgi:hypothetical protein
VYRILELSGLEDAAELLYAPLEMATDLPVVGGYLEHFFLLQYVMAGGQFPLIPYP